MIVKLLIEHHLKMLRFKGGRTGSSKSTLVKMSHCWKSLHGSLTLSSHMLSYLSSLLMSLPYTEPGNIKITGFIQGSLSEIQGLFEDFSRLFYSFHFSRLFYSFQGLKV